MKFRGLRLALLLSMCCSVPLFAQYTGGFEDGNSNASFCSTDLNGAASPTITLSLIQGNTVFCSGGSDVYSVNITNSTTANSFVWTIPIGASILYSLNTPTSSIISINFGTATSGNISVTATNTCSSVTATPIAVSSTACSNYQGGADDGFSNASFCATTLNGATAPSITISSVVGSSSFCNQGTDIYSVNITSGIANSIVWSVPTGASVSFSVNTPTSSVVNINFGSSAGNISVTASNSCSTVTSSVLVLTNNACNNYFGSNDDGFGNAQFCASNLNGGSLGTITLSSISGGSTFCYNGSQNYSVNVLSGTATSFSWSAPAGGNLLATQNQTSGSLASIGFGNIDGNVQVTASNGCSSTSTTLALTGTNCNLTFGGNDDGFGNALFCGTDLNGAGLGPIVLNPIAGGGSPYCFSLGQNYSVATSSGLATSFVWSVTAGGGSALASQSTTTNSIATVSFPGASGTIRVDASNGCFSDFQTLAVTGQSCDNSFGGNNDGFGNSTFCATDLNSGAASVVSLLPISGGNYCINLGQLYTTSAASGNPYSFLWTVTAGTGITNALLSNFNTSAASISFSSGSATIQVTATNACSSDTQTLSISGTTCNTTVGGNDDGFSTGIFCGTNLSGGVLAPIALSAISGGSTFCFNLGQNYSVNVIAGTATSYSWSGPPGAGAFAQVDSPLSGSASLNFVGTNGNVAVTASNGCSTATATLAVTGSNCGTTIGGNNDGFSTLSFCASNLTGGTVPSVTLGPISGAGTFCFNLGDNYTVSATGSPTNYIWSGPVGSAITGTISSFVGSSSTVAFGNSNGSISVTANNACSSATQTLFVTGVNCLMSVGGANDGFSVAQAFNIPLPVTLALFTAKTIDAGVRLDWITETEINNSHFEIERSKDGKTFKTIGAVDGAGNSRVRQTYTFLDKLPYEGASYYRLKQVDFDGKFDYSPTVIVEWGGNTESYDAVLYPNPTLGNTSFNIRFNSALEGLEAVIMVQDLTGKEILTKTFSAASVTQVKSNDEVLKPGVYIVTIQVADKKIINRLVVQ